MAKEFLSRNRIHFEEKDVNADAQARWELQRRKITGVPTFLIGEEVVVGFDQAKLLKLIDHRIVLCEKCSKKMRVPVNKGTIKVTCPSCNHSFNVQTERTN